MKGGLESEPGNNLPGTSPRKVEIMVKLPFSKSQRGNIQRRSDEGGRGCDVVSQGSPAVIFGEARGDFFSFYFSAFYKLKT